jgi:hypothetical protein
LSILPWLKMHSKEIVLVTTALIVTNIKPKDALTEDQINNLVGEEEPLEIITRRITSKWLITCGTTLKQLSFVDERFKDQVGGQLILIGHLIGQMEKKE